MAAGEEVGVMGNLGVRRPGVGCIAWLGVDVAARQKVEPRSLRSEDVAVGLAMETELWKKRQPKQNAWRKENSQRRVKKEPRRARATVPPRTPEP